MKNVVPIVIGIVLLALISSKSSAQILPASGSGRRGLRNNNPGNIRISNTQWQGKVTPNTDGSFEQFTSMEYGARAMLKILATYINTYKLDTIPKIINKWSPASDGNNPTAYADSVSNATGISKSTIISTASPAKLYMIAQAMTFVENGKNESIAAGFGSGSTIWEDAWLMV